MATYLQGVSDFIPQLTPYQPDLNYYSNVLSTKQGQYNEGLSKLNSIYGSALNSPMLRSSNIERRDEYFKTITQDLQKIAGLDLSIDKNVNTAKQVFAPILNDKYIVKDMAYTKGLQRSYQTAEQYRNCIDPDKCGGSFWQEGVDALNYAQEEFQKASPDDSLRYQPPKYTPYQNVTQKAIKAAKDSGFNVSYDHNDGRYIVTDTNGQLLLGEDGRGILPQYLYGMFGNDAAVQSMYATQAYVQRKNYAKANAERFGGNEDAAESEYLNTILHQTIPKIESSQRDLTSIRNKTSANIKALEVLADSNGGTIPGDGVQDEYGRLMDLQAKTEPAEQYHKQVSDLINTAPNINDIKSLRNRVDNIVANGNFMNTINAAAYDYAMGTSKREMKADPYALASYNNSLDLSKGIALQNHEFGIWQEKEKIKNVNELAKLKGSLGMSLTDIRGMNQYLVDKGITAEKLKKENLPTDVSLWTAADFKKVKEGGLGQDVAGEISKVNTLAGAEPFEDPYIENSKLLIQSVENLKQSSSNYLKESFDTMKKQYLNPIGNNEDQKKAVREKIWSNMTSILAGTGISAQSVLDGTTGTDIFNRDIARFNKSIARAQGLQEKDISSQVLTNQWSPVALAKLQLDKQVAEGFYARRKSDNKQVLDNIKADLATNVDLSIEAVLDPERQKENLLKLDKQASMVNAIANEDGLVSKEQARARYLQQVQSLYKNDPNRLEGRTGEEVKGKSAIVKANEDFEKQYPQLIEKYSNLTNSWKSAAGSSDRGGAMAVNNETVFQVRGEQRFSPAFNQIEKIANEIPKSANVVYFTPETTELGDISQHEGKQRTANKFFEVVRNGDTKGLDFTYKLRNQPKAVSGGDVIPQGAFIDVTMTDETAKKVFNLGKEDDVTPYKAFAIQIPAGSSSTVDQFIRNTTPNNVDVYMLQEGATITQNLPNLGSYNISRNGRNMVFTGKFKGINPLTQSEQDYEFPPQNLGEVSPEKAIEVANSLLEQAGIFKQNAKKQLIANQNAGARNK